MIFALHILAPSPHPCMLSFWTFSSSRDIGSTSLNKSSCVYQTRTPALTCASCPIPSHMHVATSFLLCASFFFFLSFASVTSSFSLLVSIYFIHCILLGLVRLPQGHFIYNSYYIITPAYFSFSVLFCYRILLISIYLIPRTRIGCLFLSHLKPTSQIAVISSSSTLRLYTPSSSVHRFVSLGGGFEATRELITVSLPILPFCYR